LARGPFVAKTPDFAYWILLDFLGFSRPNLAFSMGYTGFSLKEISRALGRAGGGGGEPEPEIEAVRMRRIVHAASLI
jgi:hypothetical protein